MNKLINEISHSTDSILRTIAFLAICPLALGLFFTSMGYFGHADFLRGFVYALLALISFCFGKGINNYLIHKM